MAHPFIVEFPPETAQLIQNLAKSLGLSPEEAISRAIGLLQVWADAKKEHRIIVERPAPGAAGEELQIDVSVPATASSAPASA
jgi:hypothetical protein